MLETLFAAAAEAVFSYILDTLEPTDHPGGWLKRNPVKLAYRFAPFFSILTFPLTKPYNASNQDWAAYARPNPLSNILNNITLYKIILARRRELPCVW